MLYFTYTHPKQLPLSPSCCYCCRCCYSHHFTRQRESTLWLSSNCKLFSAVIWGFASALHIPGKWRSLAEKEHVDLYNVWGKCFICWKGLITAPIPIHHFPSAEQRCKFSQVRFFNNLNFSSPAAKPACLLLLSVYTNKLSPTANARQNEPHRPPTQ